MENVYLLKDILEKNDEYGVVIVKDDNIDIQKIIDKEIELERKKLNEDECYWIPDIKESIEKKYPAIKFRNFEKNIFI